jgi:hypothetical protein
MARSDNNIVIRNHFSVVNKEYSEKSWSSQGIEQENDRKFMFASLHLRPFLQFLDEMSVR